MAKVAKIGKDKPKPAAPATPHKVKKIVTKTVHFGEDKPAEKKAKPKKK